MSCCIRVERLTKRYHGGKALNDVSLDIRQGEMVALIGASGSGKSTLLRHISGLSVGDPATASLVRVQDREVQSGGQLSPDVRDIRSKIGFIFQQFNLVDRLPVITNALTGMLHRIPSWRSTFRHFTSDEIREGIRALERVGMAERALQRASTLSGGQQQRVAIARTLVQQAQVILADEPIASLDPESARRVMDLLSSINREDGITVVVSLHQVEVARRYCRRTLALNDGRLIYDGPSSALSGELLRELYGASAGTFETSPKPAAPAIAFASEPSSVEFAGIALPRAVTGHALTH